jgi:hypothetical protein
MKTRNAVHYVVLQHYGLYKPLLYHHVKPEVLYNTSFKISMSNDLKFPVAAKQLQDTTVRGRIW